MSLVDVGAGRGDVISRDVVCADDFPVVGVGTVPEAGPAGLGFCGEQNTRTGCALLDAKLLRPVAALGGRVGGGLGAHVGGGLRGGVRGRGRVGLDDRGLRRADGGLLLLGGESHSRFSAVPLAIVTLDRGQLIGAATRAVGTADGLVPTSAAGGVGGGVIGPSTTCDARDPPQNQGGCEQIRFAHDAPPPRDGA